MHSTLSNLIRTSISERNNKWDENLKLINFMTNTMKNQTTGLTPASSTFTYQQLIRKWKQKHEKNRKKTKERIEVEWKRLRDGWMRAE